MRWFGYALAILGGLSCVILGAITRLTDFRLDLSHVIEDGHLVFCIGFLIVIVDFFIPRKKLPPKGKDPIEAK